MVSDQNWLTGGGLSEAQLVALGAVERRAVGVALVGEIDRLALILAVDADHRADGPGLVVVLQIVALPEQADVVLVRRSPGPEAA